MEPCQDFTFRFWMHELQGQLHRDITAETRSHVVRTCQLLTADWTLCLNPTHLAVRPPRRLRKKWTMCVLLKWERIYSGGRTSCSPLTLLQPPSGWSWSCRTPGFPVLLSPARLEAWRNVSEIAAVGQTNVPSYTYTQVYGCQTYIVVEAKLVSSSFSRPSSARPRFSLLSASMGVMDRVFS